LGFADFPGILSIRGRMGIGQHQMACWDHLSSLVAIGTELSGLRLLYLHRQREWKNGFSTISDPRPPRHIPADPHQLSPDDTHPRGSYIGVDIVFEAHLLGLRMV